MECENYEVSGTTFFADYNGPMISRINKKKLVNICVYLNSTFNIQFQNWKLQHFKIFLLPDIFF